MRKAIGNYEGLNITFNVTEDCNLKCSYCYELGKKPVDLPLDYARRFIDLIISDPDPILVVGTDLEWILQQGLILDFIGGDALMRPQLCREILNYWMLASSLNRSKWATRWRGSISSNGTLFGDQQVQEFLDEFSGLISLGVSIDGCPEIHNRNRSNSMNTILDGWDWYLGYCKRSSIYPTTKSTLNRESIPFLFKSLKFLHEDMGLKIINQNFIFEDMKLEEGDLAELDRQMEKCVGYIEGHPDLYWGMLDEMLSQCGFGDPDKGWCGAGSMPALSPNGKIYPCFRFLPHTMSSRENDFHVGDVWVGFDHKERFLEVRAQTREKISPEKCRSCQDSAGCAWCIGGAFSEKGSFYRQTNICEVHKIQAKWSRIHKGEAA